ncbi:MAG: hypothetical protein IPH20_16395 [Bacteroidales bacterium]|nr:hypothetical protein [Bacteroidales bacterium]
MKLLKILTVIMFGISGIVSAQNGPVTAAGSFFNQTPGQITIPLTVTGFNNVGVISLTLEYDPAVLTFIQGVQNPALTGFLAIVDNALPTGMHRVIIGWFGNAISLPDGSTLVNLNFNYLGGSTDLIWYDDGSSCEYGDAAYNTLNDSPYECYYVNGIVTSDKKLNLSFLLEGLYDPDAHQMRSPLGFTSGPCSDAIADDVQVELHSAENYSNVVFTSDNCNVNSLGLSGLLIPASLNGSYYIVVRHRNSIETISATPVSFAGNVISYDFTDLASKAYGNNMLQMADGKWAFYAGDVNQDGSVDTGDMSPVDNDAGAYATGYLTTDVNGDEVVDTADMTIVDNNASIFVGSATP